MEVIKPKPPSRGQLANLFSESLLAAPGYHIDAPAAGIKLDQNESPIDWPLDVKRAVLSRLESMAWNRYPSPFSDELITKLAHSLGIPNESILLGPGSNYLIGILLTTLTKKKIGKVVIARPSFALYEAHCKYEDIQYEVWPLDENLEYQESLLPPLPASSIVLFASPNNPVGNSLSKDRFRQLLIKHPDVLWLADEAYVEFSSESYLDLLQDHSNLILIRTFSKTLGAAGVRLGYLVGSQAYIDQLKKPRVPFLLNQFSLAAALEVFENPTLKSSFDQFVEETIKERKKVESELVRISSKAGFSVKSSDANFLLLRWQTQEAALKYYSGLIERGILVRNVSKAPGLAGCLRVSIGTAKENKSLLDSFSQITDIFNL